MKNRAGMVNIDEIAERAAYLAIKKVKEEDRKKKEKNRFRNTELLLRNYNTFKDFLQNTKHSIRVVAKDINCEDVEEKAFVLAILRTKARTAVMLTNVEVAMEELKTRMSEKSQMEKYHVIKAVYMDGKTFEVVAEENNCSEITVRRWKNEMVDELSILLFGVDGIKLME